ncbi:MAG: UbiA family prenyltransferase [Candidatus Hydrogenedentota bacterium]
MRISRTKQIGCVLRAFRPHQWTKNTLVFLPLLLAQRWAEWHTWATAAVAFGVFCLAASGVYVVNDILDIEADRKHPSKKHRPFAAGTLSTRLGIVLAGVLFIAAVGISGAALPAAGLVIVVLYALLSTSYSVWLKRFVIVDVLVLSGLYALRILAGGLATDTSVSRWLLAFSGFFFLSLAFAKRYTELHSLSLNNGPRREAARRGYRVEDLSLLETLGPTSGYMAILVLALYINSEQMARYYANPWALWLICPVLVYWISRVWFFAKRGRLHEDPLIFALGDAISWVVAFLVVVLALLAIFFPSLPLAATK